MENKKEDSKKEVDKTETKTDLSSYAWMVRPCDVYSDEYSECTSIKGRFHQYFIFGESVDCSSWKKDYERCKAHERVSDPQALEELIASEKKRRLERLIPHYANKVWDNREAPPPEFHAPLPEKYQKEYEGTYLYHKAKELRGEAPNSSSQALDEVSRMCCIS